MLPIPVSAVARRGGLTCATVIVMVFVELDFNPIWWRGTLTPPPAAWAYVFEEFTGEDTAEQWALAAGIYVAQYRRRAGVGPMFSELFTHLLPETSGLPGSFPEGLEFFERRRVISSFRGHVAIEWRRRQMIGWDRNVTRSLRVGREFRAQSRRRQLSRGRGGAPRYHGAADLAGVSATTDERLLSA